MKRNAIIRIIIWSLVIVLLLGIMCSVMLGMNWKRTHYAAAEPETALTTYPVYTETFGGSITGKITEDLNIRSAPSTESTAVSLLAKGSFVHISRQENVNSQNWAYITFPQAGWILMEYVDIVDDGASIEETSVFVEIAESGQKTSFSAGEISELEIEWVAGEILIQTGNSDQITVKEDGVSDEKYAMVLNQKGGKLKITFCEESVTNYFGINNAANLSKDLTITVPSDWVCDSLSIDCASATVEINDMTIREVEFDGASGTCEFENCTVDELDIDTASGDIRFIGTLNALDCDAASASVYAVLSNTPSRLDMDTMSGDLDITLPADAGFTVTMDGMTSDFSSDFETIVRNGNQVCGDGRCRINISAMSGDVAIRKGESDAVSTIPEAPTAPDAPTAP